MANTWDTSRVGGGTYEFQKDSSGNYTLNSVGFNKLNKLNLPELKAEATTTTTGQAKDTATASAQTTKAFGNVQPFYYNQKGGGGADQSMSITKDKTLTENLRTDTKPGMLGDDGGSMVRDTKPGMLGDDGGSIKRDTTPEWAKGADKRGYENIGKKAEPTNQIGRTNAGTVLAAREAAESPNRFSGITGPQKPSPYQDAIMRGETGVKYQKPEIQKTVSTQLKQVRTALSPLAKAVGFVMNPVKGLIGMAAGALPKDSPTDKFNRQYFNTVGNTSRIAGNPSTDLYAGFNQTSAFGNTERAGAKRIATREATIARRGIKSKSNPKGISQKFVDNTNNMKTQQNDYQRDKGKANTKAAKAKGLDVSNPNEMRSAGGGGNGGNGGRVICTELHSAGEMSTKDWIRDTQFTFKGLTPEHVKGYLFWAIPTVVHMKKYPKYRKIWKHIAQHRANDIAWRLNQGKFDLLGRLYAGIGEPLCWLLGNFVGNKEFNELNIKNWRKV